MTGNEKKLLIAAGALNNSIRLDYKQYHSERQINQALKYASWLIDKLEEKMAEPNPQVAHYIAKVLTTKPNNRIRTIGCGKCGEEIALRSISTSFTCRNCGIEHHYRQVKGYYEATEYLLMEED